jgi:cytochrome c556
MPDTPNTAEPGKPRRRRFQFRLRTLLIGMALVGAICACAAPAVQRWQERAERHELLKKVMAEISRGGIRF